MADGLEAMPVDVAHERSVVVGTVVRADPWRSLIGAPVRERGRVERIDARTARGAKREVEALARRAAIGAAGRRVARPQQDRERRLAREARRPVADRARARGEADVPEGREGRVVEGRSPLEIRDAEGEVIEHERQAWALGETKLIARSAMAVIVSDGFTPGFALTALPSIT